MKAAFVLFFLLAASTLQAQTSSWQESFNHYFHQSRTLGEEDRWNDALLYADSLLAIARQEGNLDSLAIVYRWRYELLLAKHDYNRALQEFRTYEQLKDSLNSLINNRLRDSLQLLVLGKEEQLKLEATRHKAELDQIRSDTSRQFRTYLSTLLGLAIILVVVAFVFLRRLRQYQLESESLKNELLRSNEFKERLFVVLSQDLKQAVARIESFGSDSSSNPQWQEGMVHLKSNIEHVMQWVSLQSGAMPFHPYLFECKSFVSDIIKLFEKAISSQRIKVEIFVPDQLQVYADQAMLRIIFHNLIANAIHFIDAGGSITVFAGQKDGLITLGVSDTGKGITQSDMENLFKARSGSELDYKGQGLGLILSKELVERHGGRMYVESTAGKGSSFYFTLPESKNF